MLLKKRMFFLFLYCLLTLNVQAHAWITPIGTEITEDEGINQTINEVVMVNLPYSKYWFNINYTANSRFEIMYPDTIYPDYRDPKQSISKGQIVRLVSFKEPFELEAINALWYTDFPQAYTGYTGYAGIFQTYQADYYWIVYHPDSPDSVVGVVVLFYPKLREGGPVGT